MKARKEVLAKKNEIQDQKEESFPAEDKKEDTAKEEEIDFDLNDPDVEQAATKIQAGFKGMKARKEVSAMKDDTLNKSNVVDQKETEKVQINQEVSSINVNLDDPELEEAATKI